MEDLTGVTQELKRKNKSVLYIIFDPSPSYIVRGSIYTDIFKQKGYRVTYIFTYSNLIRKIENIKLFRGSILSKLIQKISLLYSKIVMYNILQRINKYDALVLIKYVPVNFLNSLKAKSKAPILYDFDDSVWLDTILGIERFEHIISKVDNVYCDNEFLKKKALQFNTNSFVLPGPPQFERNKFEKKVLSYTSEVILGWVGSPSTLFYLYSIYEALEEIGKLYKNVKLVIVGTGYNNILIPPFENIKLELIPLYDQQSMFRFVNSFDIGLYPLFENTLTQGRGSLKATIYMGCKVPVIACKLGENINLIENGINGFSPVSAGRLADQLALF